MLSQSGPLRGPEIEAGRSRRGHLAEPDAPTEGPSADCCAWSYTTSSFRSCAFSSGDNGTTARRAVHSGTAGYSAETSGTSAQPQSAAPPGGMTPRHASQRGMLVFPSPLNLVPGREAEAAGQILNLNGISPQHPNYGAGVQAITGILQNFARNNPSGGSLPTDDMQRVIIQL